MAAQLGRDGWFVVTVDPLVTLDGTDQLPKPEETTADRIVAAGGSARATSVSVTDGEALRTLFREIDVEFGGLDAVVNVAGITRQTYFGRGTEEDWQAVLAVHLQGYLNVLQAALPIMAAAGFGRVLGVTSGSGWRAADAGAYSCAKRAVAALTWQLGKEAPAGVTVNAMSPIAMTRMMASALERARKAGQSGGGGISFLTVPEPEDLGPFAAYSPPPARQVPVEADGGGVDSPSRRVGSQMGGHDVVPMEKSYGSRWSSTPLCRSGQPRGRQRCHGLGDHDPARTG